MGDTKTSRTVVLANPQGLHARPADMVVKLANKFASQVWLVKGAERVDAKSILGLLTLAATQGTEISIEANGDDASQAVDAISNLLAHPFPEE